MIINGQFAANSNCIESINKRPLVYRSARARDENKINKYIRYNEQIE